MAKGTNTADGAKGSAGRVAIELTMPRMMGGVMVKEGTRLAWVDLAPGVSPADFDKVLHAGTMAVVCESKAPAVTASE